MDTTAQTSDSGQTQNKKPGVVKIIIYIVVGIIAVMAFFRSINPDNNILGIENMREAYGYAKEVVQDSFISKVKFPKFKSEFITDKRESITYEGQEYRLYTVKSYFDMKNMFNVEIRDEYIITIGLPVNNDVDTYYYEVVADSAELLDGYMDYDSYEEENAGKVYTYR